MTAVATRRRVGARLGLLRVALLAIGVTTLYVYGEHAFDSVWGQPSRQLLPERFVLLA